ncbi:2-C-methyl-D-erythritol 4-phosphate cytidylyltransferase [Ectobacillus polymachus]|uniref:2-C-methyl-D-erythritol 4-phosphate cytidylyltransferase n=1 Tax=Ectobacillus polymachus TaxID=1508806 RepID=UPI003A88DFA0
MKYTLIIPAAGRGKRMGADKNKLFLSISSVPLIIHTLRAFEQDVKCERIILAIHEDDQALFEHFILKYDIKKEIVFVKGGQERQDSVYNAVMKAIDSSYVLVHDGARPFITQAVIDDVLRMAQCKGASICAVPVKDTIKRVQDMSVVETIERSSLWSVQTPQGFQTSILYEAHERAKKDGFFGTDDASLVEYIQKEVGVVQGSYYNIKITTPDDLVVAESFLSDR